MNEHWYPSPEQHSDWLIAQKERNASEKKRKRIPSKWLKKNNRSLGQIRRKIKKDMERAEVKIERHLCSIENLRTKVGKREADLETILELMMKNKAEKCPCFRKESPRRAKCLLETAYPQPLRAMYQICWECKTRNPETKVLVRKIK